MIKKWNQFNESKAQKPGKNIPGSVKVNITEEEVNYFTEENALEKLVMDDKVALIGREVWYWEGDEETRSILDQYLEIPSEVELESTNEEFFGGNAGEDIDIKIESDGGVTTRYVVNLIQKALSNIGGEINLTVNGKVVDPRGM